jgi:D-alanyl-D-alanine carboxypeptidase (penicillin-binding protein 5/6)
LIRHLGEKVKLGLSAKLPFYLFLIIALVCPSDASARGITAASALLWDATDGHNDYAKAPDRRIFPASTTKIMTVLLVLEKLPLEGYVTVSERATQVQPTKLGLKAGERYRVRDLLYGMLLKSANDASIVLAEAVAGSEAKFVEMMNRRAWEVGARHTHFANSHGLPSNTRQYSTAHDMALIFREALKQDFFSKAVTFKYRIIYSKDGRRHFLKSHNKLLFLNWKRDVYGKTGYTRQAQSCFVGYFNKGGHTRIIAVFGCHKRWEDIKFIIERYGKTDL